MNKPISVVLVGAGDRANAYASVSLESPENARCWDSSPDPIRTELMRKRYNVPVENCFTDTSEFVKRENLPTLL